MPSPQDKWEQFAEPSGDKWDQFAEPSKEANQVASRPSQKATFDIPRSSSEMIGEGAEAEGAGREKMAREHPGALASVALAGLPLPTKGLAGVATNVVTRGAGALSGAAYGGRLASEAGLPRWPGQVIGGAAGLFAPEVISKLGGSLISRIATLVGKSAAPQVAAAVAEDSTLAQVLGRDVAERAARGAPLTPAQEELLYQHVQQHYTPEVGVDASAQRAGKVYAGRGSTFRPTNEQLGLSKAEARAATVAGRRAAIPPPPDPTATATPSPTSTNGSSMPAGFQDVTQGSSEGAVTQPTNPTEGTPPTHAQLEWESNRRLASGKKPEAFTRAEEIAKRGGAGAGMTPKQAVEEAGGTYVGKGAAGHEIKLPASMTKDLPISEFMKGHVSITIPEGVEITPAKVRSLMAAKVTEFRK